MSWLTIAIIVFIFILAWPVFVYVTCHVSMAAVLDAIRNRSINQTEGKTNGKKEEETK